MHRWKDEGKCLGMDTNFFFDKYEEDHALAKTVDSICNSCPINRKCFAWGVTNKEWGVWGGVYLKDGKIDNEFNSHKDKNSWSKTWESLTMEAK